MGPIDEYPPKVPDMKIGDVREYKGRYYQAAEETEGVCIGCDLQLGTGLCAGSSGTLGRCTTFRKDGKDIIFKEHIEMNLTNTLDINVGYPVSCFCEHQQTTYKGILKRSKPGWKLMLDPKGTFLYFPTSAVEVLTTQPLRLKIKNRK